MAEFVTSWGSLVLLAPAYLPLGVIGVWRWSVWLIKRTLGSFYRPDLGHYEATVSVVTPVYNEDPVLFWNALQSWKANGVDEIVAVIDHTDTKCEAVFDRFALDFPGAVKIVTEKPGKRPALADGSLVATSEVIALVDSDTIWDSDVREVSLAPFRHQGVGGVTMRQRVLEVKTLSQRLFNSHQNVRFNDEYPFLTAIDGSTVHCLSGRTAFYRREALLPTLDGLLNETFFGRKVISGDDKRITYLVEAAGWKVAYQSNTSVYTPGVESMKEFLKQRLRWTRNSWRADLRSLSEPWAWRKPYFSLFLLDRAVQPFTLLLGPIYFVSSLLLGLWLPALLLVVWWHVSRFVRLWPHLKTRPQDVFLIPLYILVSYYFGLLKIYALFTLNRQGWITRWDKNRLGVSLSWFRLVPAYLATILTIFALSGVVMAYKQEALESRVVRSLSDGVVLISYNASQDMIRVTGDNQRVSLPIIAQSIGDEYLREVLPGIWYLRANLEIDDGVRLWFDPETFKELRLGIDERGREVRLFGVDGLPDSLLE